MYIPIKKLKINSESILSLKSKVQNNEYSVLPFVFNTLSTCEKKSIYLNISICLYMHKISLGKKTRNW